MAYDIENLAEDILASGSDRVPSLKDRRSLRRLERKGLLVYPDGSYSVTVDAMRDALSWFRTVLAECETSKTSKLDYWRGIVAKAETFITAHESRPEGPFGPLKTDAYLTLWEATVSPNGALVAECVGTKKFRSKLIKDGMFELTTIKGEPAADGVMVRPTEAGKALVSSIGNPYLI